VSLLSLLKDVGKGLEDFGKWVEDALPTIANIITAVDPPLAPVVTTVESIIKDLENIGQKPTAQELQAITQAVTVLQSIQAAITAGQLVQLNKSS
jgi:hypothetical protein